MRNDRNITVLIADDNPNNLKVLSDMLISFGYEVRVAVNGKTAVESAKAELPDMILMDIHMPEMNGYEACIKLKSSSKTKEVPIIFVSAVNEEFNKVKAFEMGAVDYLTKPLQIEETRARVKVHLDLRRKILELEEFNRVMVNREMRIIELKNEVNRLADKLGEKTPYPEVWDDSDGDNK